MKPDALRQVTLVFLLKEDQILLAMKKRGFGQGKWNGAGGKVEPGETTDAAARRECSEEIGVSLRQINKVAVIDFYSPKGMEANNQQVHVYICREWENEPIESEEMRPKWFDITDIPYDLMWADDKFWLPEILTGKKVKAEFYFDEADNVINHKITDLGV